MNAVAALILALAVSPAAASDPNLRVRPSVDVGYFSGLTLSPGSGRRVCARVTADPKTAESGGRIYLTDAGDAGEGDAIRLSDAVITPRAGLLSFAAIIARRHAVVAVAVAGARWDDSHQFVVREPIFGPISGYFMPVVGERDRIINEGDVACVDPARGGIEFPPADRAQALLDASLAVRAYDGLRDVGALERWLQMDFSPMRADALMGEMASRALDGEISAENLKRLKVAAKGAVGGSAWRRALGLAAVQSGDCAASAADAPSADVLDRLVRDASTLSSRAEAAGKIYGAGADELITAARSCRVAAEKRRLKVPRTAPSLEDAAVAAGASRGASATISSSAWMAFVADNNLSEYLSRAVDDASLGLRRKSERIREKIMSSTLSPESSAGRAIVAATASCPCLVVGDDATVKVADSRAALAAAREAWAASWGPGPLGARLRAGRGLDYSGILRIVFDKKADASGVAFTRDPGTGRRHLQIELNENQTDLTAVERARVIRLARALDAWRGGGVEVAFAFSGKDLFVRHARPLEPPKPLQPLTDPFSPRPAAQALNVKSVR